MSGLDLSKHFSLYSSEAVNQICTPVLKKIGITYFNYIKIYNKDSSRDLLTNNSAWIEHFYQNSLYKSAAAIDVEHLLPKGYFLWSELDINDPVYSQGRETFNIDNGVSFVIKRDDVTYLYIFASTRENHKINSFYVRNIDLFKRFILYFNDKGSSLIKESAKNRIYLPEIQNIDNDKLKINDFTSDEREDFYNATTVDKYFLFGQSDDLYLTKKQAECAVYFIEGATAKQCANMMGISYRTVEAYLNDIKEKIFHSTGRRLSKDELIHFLKKEGIHDSVFPGKLDI